MALKKSAGINHRSLNGETLDWLERQASVKRVSAKETAAILRKFKRALSAAQLRKMAASIERVRRLMANEHLH